MYSPLPLRTYSSSDALPTELADTAGFTWWKAWSVVTRNRLLVLSAVIISPLIAGVVASLIHPVFSSTLSLRIEEKKSGLPVLEALTALSDQGGELSTEMEVLRSRTLAEQTVDSLGLQATVVIPRSVWSRIISRNRLPKPRSEVLSSVRVARSSGGAQYHFARVSDARFSVVDAASGKKIGDVVSGVPQSIGSMSFILAPSARQFQAFDIHVSPFANAVASYRTKIFVQRLQRDANFVNVRFESEDPQLAADVPNVLADRFLQLRNQTTKAEARSTVVFLREQIDTLSRQLAATEDALRAFREGNQVVSLTDEANIRVSELTRLQAERNQKQAEHDALQSALAEAERASKESGTDSTSAYRGLMAYPTLAQTGAVQYLQALNEAENQRALLLQRRTRQNRDVQVLTARISDLERQITASVKAYLAGLKSQVNSMDAALAKFGRQMDRIPSKEMRFIRLQRQNKVLADIYTLLQTRLQEARIAQAVEDSRVSIVDPALVPVKPTRPNRKRYVLLGLLVGLLAGIGLAVIREMLDRTIHMREEVAQITGGATLGQIPRIRKPAPDRHRLRANGTRAGITRDADASNALSHWTAIHQNPGDPVTEAYRTLRTNLMYSRPDDPLRVLVITSPSPGDGKSTTAANLALTFAHRGSRVLVIDADMRRGSLDKVFAIPREPGLSTVLVGAATADTVIQRLHLEGAGALDLLTSGTYPPNPSELFSSRRMTELIEYCAKAYDIAILDAPPITLVTDAAILGRLAGGVILVVRAGATQKGALSYAMEQLRNVNAPLIGTVLNDFDFQRDARYASYQAYASSYGGYAGYSYGSKVAAKMKEKDAQGKA